MASEENRRKFSFLKTIYIATRPQRISILQTISTIQIKLLQEACYNLLLNSELDISPQNTRHIHKHLLVVKLIASRKVSLLQKRTLIEKHEYLIKVIAGIASDYFEKTL
jgi:hypothetical protein